MWTYYFRLALTSIRQSLLLSILMMVAIGFGVSFLVVLTTVRELETRSPLPEKEHSLYALQLDTWAKNRKYHWNSNGIPDQLTFRDARAVLNSDIPSGKALLCATGVAIKNPDRDIPANVELGYMVTRDFFPMFDVDFLHGGPWSQQNDFNGISAIVINEWLSEKLFGDNNSVGKTLMVDGQPFQITGVVKNSWNLVPRLYDLFTRPYGTSGAIYVPLENMMNSNYAVWGGWKTWGTQTADHEHLLNGEIVWIRAWLQLDNDDQKSRFAQYLKGYIDEQFQKDRFPRSQTFLLHSPKQWMQNVAPSGAGSMDYALASLFFSVCLINALILLLARFTSRQHESALRRALGAPKTSIFAQHLTESLTICLGGGALGLVLSVFWIMLLERFYSGWSHQFFAEYIGLNIYSLMYALGLVLVASLVVGSLPAWRVSRVAPARLLSGE